VELWQKIKNGDVKVIIGARSSVFLPFQQLGLVIVDEEHDSSYKQNDPAPRYHARDAVIYLSQIHQCHTLLGSATPAFETYHNCKNGKFGLVQLDGRYGKLEHPILSLANIAEDKRVKLNKGNFTAALFAAISEALENKEQVILFQNRRGYAPVLECNTCGWAPRCIHCDISLTYHKYHEQLRCHYCGYSIALIKQCAACAGTDLSLKGLGTERIEDEINQHFPLAKVLRLDQDAAKTKKGHDKIIHAFGSHEADILVGTQMLSKGLDFEKVSLVGVINADQLLNFPDFRAHERAYQLLTQVSGRAGRKNKRGLVIIQTSAPNHPTIQKVVHQAFYNLYEEELQSRLTFHYPPFTRLIKLTIKHKDYKTAAMAASQLKNLLLPVFKEHLIGPESPHVSKIRNWYLKEILLKISKSDHSLSDKKNFIRKSITALQSDKSLKGIIFQTDVDPY
jgi:primosomal protein N' (replication factor Y)